MANLFNRVIRFLKLSSVPPKMPRPSALASSVLNGIPLEILRHIMSFLPSESAAAFSLSCVHLKYLLGTAYITKASSSSKDLVALIELLAHDLPDHIACRICERLHSIKHIQKYKSAYKNHSLQLLACITKDLKDRTWNISRMFGTTSMKMAIKRSLYKPECTELLDAMSSKEAETRVVSNYVQQSKEECRIVNGHLLHRLQSAYICYHPSIDWQFQDLSPLMHICPHFPFRENMDKIGKGVQRCGKCRTEYRFNIEDHGSNAHIILVTRWKDLGTDPESDTWRQHLRFPQRSLSKIRQAFIQHTKSEITEECQVEDVWSEIGDLPSVFGDSDHFQYDSLFTKENKEALLWHRKRL